MRFRRQAVGAIAGFALALAFVPAADAEFGVLGHSSGVAPSFDVNWNGTGGAAPGDAYTGGQTVSQASLTGSGLVRTWGLDVIQSGPGNANESQAVRVEATGGTFALSFGGETTGPIPHNASNGQVQTELNALASIGGVGGAVAVSGGPGDASGSTPYLVSFGGIQGGANQPLIDPDDAFLTGPNANAFTATTNPGGTGFEICEPGTGDICKPATETFPDIELGGGVGEAARPAVDQITGDVYLSNSRHGLNKYSATGELLATFGYDVVSIGPNDSSVNQKFRLTVQGTGGSFTVGIFLPGFGFQSSMPILHDAPAAEVEQKINAIPSVKEKRGAVTVTGGPGDATGSNPYVLTLGGTMAGDQATPNLSASSAGLEGSGRLVRVLQIQEGGAPEICTPSDACKGAIPNGKAGSLSGGNAVTVAPPGSPNEGNVLVADAPFSIFAPGRRIMEYTSGGQFIRTFGGDVVETGPDDSNADEQQKVTVKATGGKFSLSYNGVTTGAVGTGDLANGSNVVTNLVVADSNFEGRDFGPNGAFEVGEAITGVGIPPGTTIAALTPTTLTMSAPATTTFANRPLTANDIDFNATPAQVKAALEALPTIGGAGGTVTVTDGPGDLAGATPYTVTFGGGLGGDSLFSMTASSAGLTIAPGTPSATVATSTEGGAFEVCIPSQGDVCKGGTTGPGVGQFDARGIQDLVQDQNGVVYTLEGIGELASINRRVQRFTPLPGPPHIQPSLVSYDERQDVTVNATAGQFRISAVEVGGTTATAKWSTSDPGVVTIQSVAEGAFHVGHPFILDGFSQPGENTVITKIEGNTITLSQPIFSNCNVGCDVSSNALQTTADLSATASPAEVQAALNALPAIAAGGGSATVTGGPGDATGSSPYEIVFGGGPRAGTDVPAMVVSEGTAPLSGGTGVGANTVALSTIAEGGPSGNAANRPKGIAITPGGDLIIAKDYGRGASVCEDGTRSPRETRLHIVSPSGNWTGASKACATDLSQPAQGDQQLLIGGTDGLGVDPNTGVVYLAEGSVFGGTGIVYAFGEAGSLPNLNLDPPSDLSATGVTISGEINPNSPTSIPVKTLADTRYRVDYREVGASQWQQFSPSVALGVGTDPIPFNVGISILAPKTEYEARVVVIKPFGFRQLVGVTPPFTTPAAAPKIDSLGAVNLTAASVDLNAVINPQGAETTYHFEYGTTLDFGQSTPPVSIGSSTTPELVQQHLEGLEPNVYYFRVVATSAEGTTSSNKQSFNFYPEPCPNRNARQQTGSSGLPDCRAYELVSPSYAGTAVLHHGGPFSPYASNPSRFVYEAAINSIPGPWNPENFLNDRYVATRSSVGWATAYISGEADQFPLFGQPLTAERVVYSDLALGQFIDWKSPLNGGVFMAPYVKDAEGRTIGRLPTNLAEIPGADLDEAFVGDVRPSADLSNYFFSSDSLAFAPGGVTAGMGSAYDNDRTSRTVTVASKTPAGNDIPREPGDISNGFIQLPAASRDGSHILMSAPERGLCGKGLCGEGVDACDDSPDGFPNSCELQPGHLYMRVGGAVTYDVSRGQSVRYEGMTDDGSRVLFTTDRKLTPDDHDESIDLFEWSEAGDVLKRISAGPGSVGDTNACAAAWIARCGVAVVPRAPALGIYGGQNQANSQPSDNAIAGVNGAVYFYSPEQLVGSNGIPGRRNLYVARQGALDYVATLDADRPITRIQVSPSGDFAAFVTRSRLTAFDTAGFGQMYLFDRARRELACASCDPAGVLPSGNVEASQNGIFMTEDGRAFFSTPDPLVQPDTNGIADVYEFVAGRPQLISSGAGLIAENDAAPAGLIGVSNDGIDVYFSTLDTLVAEDENGSFLKFYDARTNGGFARPAVLAPCAAADECHGGGTQVASPPAIASTAALGSGGNLSAAKTKKPGKKTKRKKKRRHKKNHGRAKKGARHGSGVGK